MLLDRIDIDEHGPLNRVELGPLGEQLNVVFAPIGSGKTAVARFVRDTLVDRQYPVGMLSSSTGRVVWATRSGLVHCCREQDGTHQGRRRVQVEPRGAVEPGYDALRSSWLESIAASDSIHRSLDAIELPETIVDGVITDTAVTNVAKVVAACVRHGLDQQETYRSLPLTEQAIESIDADRREQLRAELASVQAEIARIGEIESDHQSLVARRNTLNAQLAGWYRNDHRNDHSPGFNGNSENYDQLHRRSNQMHAQVRQLRARQSELRNLIADLERQLDGRRSGGMTTSDVDDHLVRLRRTLMNVTTELDTCLEKAADIRRSMRWTDGRSYWMDRDAVVAELRRIDDTLAAFSRRQWLVSRRNRLQHQLGHHTVTTAPASPLTSEASRWLVRLSGGRLNRIDWTSQELVRGNEQRFHRVSVHINGRPESEFTSPDRALASLAVRMAAGDLLARTGRHVPLVVETQREMWQTQQHFVKPDATARNLTGKINAVFEEGGLRIVAQKRIRMTKEQAEGFYAVHSERPFFNDLVSYMTSGPVVVQALQGESAIDLNRKLMGATNPAEADAGTIRADYAASIEENVVHGSDGPDTAQEEITFFFGDDGVCPRTR